MGERNSKLHKLALSVETLVGGVGKTACLAFGIASGSFVARKIYEKYAPNALLSPYSCPYAGDGLSLHEKVVFASNMLTGLSVLTYGLENNGIGLSEAPSVGLAFIAANNLVTSTTALFVAGRELKQKKQSLNNDKPKMK